MTTTPAAAPAPAPAGSPLLADPQQIREAAARKRTSTGTRSSRAGGKPTPPPATEPISPEEQAFWARQVQTLCNQLAAVRDYPKLPDELAAGMGEAAALTARKWTPKLSDHPELLLLSLLGPWLLNVVRIEGERLGGWLRERRAVAEGRPSGHPRADRPGEDGAGAQPDSEWTPALGANPDS